MGLFLSVDGMSRFSQTRRSGGRYWTKRPVATCSASDGVNFSAGIQARAANQEVTASKVTELIPSVHLAPGKARLTGPIYFNRIRLAAACLCFSYWSSLAMRLRTIARASRQ